jgi:hypothetical protein
MNVAEQMQVSNPARLIGTIARTVENFRTERIEGPNLDAGAPLPGGFRPPPGAADQGQ